MDLKDILLSSASSGALGIIGAVATGVLTFFQKKQDHKFEIERMKEQRESDKMLGEIKQAEIAGAIAQSREKSAGDAFTASYHHATSARSGIKWITGFVEFTRPGLTWFFTIISTYLTVCSTFGILVVSTVEDPIAQYAMVTVLNTTSMMIAWWFGQRQIDKVTVAWGNRTAGASVGPAKP